jgi:hypothetical protein
VNANSTLPWTNLRYYENCPQQLLWLKGWGMIDCGGGPGMPKPRPKRESLHHPVMGMVVQAAVEALYNDELWVDPPHLIENMLRIVDREWFRLIKDKRNHIDYTRAGMTAAEMLEVCRDGVIGYVQTMKAHKLLSLEYAKAEVPLIGWIDKWNPVGGTADVILRREDTGITILDGKNSRRKEADPDQLRWYALLFRLAYKQLPDRLGFVWYRFPYGQEARDGDGNILYEEDRETPRIEQGVQWIDFSEDDLRGLAQRALDAKKAMRKELFDPRPEPSYCKKCVFEEVCEARQRQRKANAEKRNKNRRLDEIDDEGGFSDFSL